MKTQILFLSIIILIFSGCVSIDSRAWNETADQISTYTISGNFSNQASYKSTGNFIAVDNLAKLLSMQSEKRSVVNISLDENIGLTFKFSDCDETKVYKFTDGLVIDSDGEIHLPSNSICGMKDGTLGCQEKNITLFINKQGNLVTIQSGGGAGLFGPFPIGIYAKHVAIFNRLN